MIYDFITAKKGDDFVGFKVNNEKIEIHLPIGYEISSEQQSQLSDTELRKKISNLVSVIVETKHKREGELKSFIVTKSGKSYDFPVSACIFLIRDFFKNGYYTKKETVFSKDNSGKIHWEKTIKSIRPNLTKKNSPVYFDFCIRKSSVNDRELITEIHKYCIWHVFSVIGFLFSSYKPEKPHIHYNKKVFIKILNANMKQSFAQKETMLFQNMLALIENVDDEKSISSVTVGTTNFEHVWERMIDVAYGNTGEFKKEDFFPFAEWHIGNRNNIAGNLYPDTISLYSHNNIKKCFIIDAKYYGYKNGDGNTLPSMESIAKQRHYGEYIYKNSDKFGITEPEKNILNVFLIPYNLTSCENLKVPKYIGFADEPWNDNSKNYQTIHCMAIDCKTLIDNYSNDKERIVLLDQEVTKQTCKELL